MGQVEEEEGRKDLLWYSDTIREMACFSSLLSNTTFPTLSPHEVRPKQFCLPKFFVDVDTRKKKRVEREKEKVE